ncbi:MAG TPA: hypothetical protein VN442_13340 [Bryobacteraceae bacterium]|nr:hypothetical protein [Bryobacteraceae bacterium]
MCFQFSWYGQPVRKGATEACGGHPVVTQVPGQVRTDVANAEQQLNAMAKQIAAARHITFAQAYVQALKENPHLYQQYLAEHPQQNGAARG